ncbi:PREDICTED: rhomboid-like protein 11, chloroplastic [Camelina sativa]|uniref:Rhomboid-like protein 11, chloroplastic n=1 Tax=Camelina sativa TaxID=90675 RepID=A0ABM1QVC8_CAMSA|nr:PREDICTED: rhomboid-like protein 11, chloroplastic [Camelina sativa]
MSQLHLHLHLHGHYLYLPHSSLRSRFPSSPYLHLFGAAFSSTNPPLSLSLNSTKSTVSCPLTVVRSRFSEPGEDSFSDITPQYVLSKTQDKQKPQKLANGIFLIILINLAIFMAEHFYQVRWIKSLYLYSDFPVWYQFVTATFRYGISLQISSLFSSRRLPPPQLPPNPLDSTETRSASTSSTISCHLNSRFGYLYYTKFVSIETQKQPWSRFGVFVDEDQNKTL